MSALRSLRAYAWAEGASLLVLCLIAMPLKYAFGLPLAVRFVGSVHGLCFLLFVLALYRAHGEGALSTRRSLGALGSAFVPGAVFLLDRVLREQLKNS